MERVPCEGRGRRGGEGRGGGGEAHNHIVICGLRCVVQGRGVCHKGGCGGVPQGKVWGCATREGVGVCHKGGVCGVCATREGCGPKMCANCPPAHRQLMSS